MMTCSVILSTSGCRVLCPPREVVTEKHDTVFVEKRVVERDTVIRTKRATVTTTVFVPCPHDHTGSRQTFPPVIQKHENATLRLWMDAKGVLHAECNCDEVAINAKLRDYYEREYRAKTKTETITVKEQYIPGIIWVLAWIGGVASIVVLAVGAIKIKSIIS